MDVIGVVFDVGMVVEPLRSPVDNVEGVADLPNFAIIAVKSADVKFTGGRCTCRGCS